jgi:CheY-like chemotaxis protein
MGRPLSGPLAMADLAGVRVLVVDDHDDTRDLLKVMFETAGAEVTSAASAEEGLEAATSVPPDLLIADIGMPRVDGYTFVGLFRERHPGVPSIAVSAYAKPEDSARARAAGFDAYHAKPIVPADLLQLSSELLKQRV